jgi:hypothetical protein
LVKRKIKGNVTEVITGHIECATQIAKTSLAGARQLKESHLCDAPYRICNQNMKDLIGWELSIERDVILEVK